MSAAIVTVLCPHCNGRMRASTEHVGRKGRCTFCKKLVEIRAAPEDSLATIQPTVSMGASRDADSRLCSTNVPAWQAGILGAAATALLYLLLLLLFRDTSLGQKFVDRGPMQYATTLVTFWGLALLALKYRAVKKQRSYAGQELEFFPLDIGVQISPGNVDQFLAHVGNLARPQRLSILGHRIQGALEHFKSRNRVPEVQQYLATQAELDASAVDSGYALLRSFIWVIPLFGFIGTVMGIGDAVAGLDQSLKGAAGQEQLLSGLAVVTAGLATAFDTTFVALVMAILLLFPTEALRRIEYGMLDRIEAFSNESLLRRMVDEPTPGAEGNRPELVREALDAAFREHQRWLVQWQAQVSQLGQLIGKDFESAVTRIRDQAAQAEGARLESYQNLSQSLHSTLAEAHKALEGQAQLCRILSDHSVEAMFARLGDQIGRLSDKIDAAQAPVNDAGSDDLLRPVAGARPQHAAAPRNLFAWLFGGRGT